MPRLPTRSLYHPPPAVEVAPDLVALAVEALELAPSDGLNAKAKTAFEARNRARALVLLRAIDWTAFQWFWHESGLEAERRHDQSAHLPSVGTKARSIPSATVLAVAARDSWTCRYCGLRVVTPALLKALQIQLPAALPPGARAVDESPAYRVLRCTLDHVAPHSQGGTNEAENLVTSCGACNFNKGNCDVDELRLIDPRSRPVEESGWEGLSGRLDTKLF